MSVCRRIILIFLVFLLFESVVGEIHRAKPTWTKNVAGGNHHHSFSQHHKPHLKYSSGSNNVAPRATVSSSSSKRSSKDEDSFGSSGSPWMSLTTSQTDRDEDSDHYIDGDDHKTLGVAVMRTLASYFSDKDHDDDYGGGGRGGSIADRIRQQPQDIETWIFTLISASFVGLSGVLPLVVIPLEAGKSLREGAGYNKLKLFLSFAVGGLLGDVFLHLLPEAWSHVNTSEDFMWIGKWVLVGILLFLIIEKVMGEQNAESKEIESSDPVTEKILNESSTNEHKINHTSSKCLDGHSCHNLTQRKSQICQTPKHDDVSKVNKLKKNESSENKNEANKENIKISGYLNLFANCVDNFTHGLAIAGSYLVSRKVGIITTIAILLHEIPHEVGDFAILLRAGFDRWKAAKAQLLTATGGLLGAFTALTAESAEEAGVKTAWILPFTAGGFIYIALVTIVPELVKEDDLKQSLYQVFCICAGIFCMLLVTLVFE